MTDNPDVLVNPGGHLINSMLNSKMSRQSTRHWYAHNHASGGPFTRLNPLSALVSHQKRFLVGRVQYSTKSTTSLPRFSQSLSHLVLGTYRSISFVADTLLVSRGRLRTCSRNIRGVVQTLCVVCVSTINPALVCPQPRLRWPIHASQPAERTSVTPKQIPSGPGSILVQ